METEQTKLKQVQTVLEDLNTKTFPICKIKKTKKKNPNKYINFFSTKFVLLFQVSVKIVCVSEGRERETERK